MVDLIKRLFPVLLLLIIGTLLALYLVPGELEQMRWELSGMPESYPIEQKCRPIFLLLLCYIPFLASIPYLCMGTMDRYVSRVYINYFILCTCILLVIYLLADFTDNMERFRTHFDDPTVQALRFYGTQLPMLLCQILPYTLMMGALWALSKLSGSSELTGMLQSGRSLLRVCMPIFFYTGVGALAYGIFGFHWAPNGYLYRQAILKQEHLPNDQAPPIIYRSDAFSRIWRVQNPATFHNPGRPMRRVVVEQFDKATPGPPTVQYFAESAVWNKKTSVWTLHNAYIRRLARAGLRPPDEEFHSELVCNFGEKPYQIISPAQGNRVDAMGTSVLYELLKAGAGSPEDRRRYRTEWHERIAGIFSCFVLVLLAVPSAVTFRRRSPMKGIGVAILLAALMLFLYRVFPSLGDSGLLPAWLSAWFPNIIYVAIACYLIQQHPAFRSVAEWLRTKRNRLP